MTNISFESGSALVSASRGPIAPAYETETLEQIYRLSETFAKAGLAPSQGVAVAKALRGLALGLDIMQSQMVLYAFPTNGGIQIGMWAKELISLVRSRGVIVRLTNDPTDPQTTDLSFARWVAHVDGEEVGAVYTEAEAKEIRLWEKWKKNGHNPLNMLVWRAASRLIDRHLAHVIGAGLPTGETLEDVQQSEILNATVVTSRPSPKSSPTKSSGPVTAADVERLRLEFLNTVEGDETSLDELWRTWRLPIEVTDEHADAIASVLETSIARARILVRIWRINRDIRELDGKEVFVKSPWRQSTTHLQREFRIAEARLKKLQETR